MPINTVTRSKQAVLFPEYTHNSETGVRVYPTYTDVVRRDIYKCMATTLEKP